MAHYRTSIETQRTPESSFNYLSDFSTSAQWDPGVVEAQRLSDGPISVGSKFRIVTAFLGRKLSLEYEITTFEPSTRVVFEAHSKTFTSHDEITFTPSDTGTIVEYEADLQLLGLARLGEPFLQLAFRRIGDHARDGLQRELDRGIDQ
jgi:carbon monoxide dehydrogenase subunit G